MTKLPYKHISEVLDEYDAFLVDIWGGIIEGSYSYPGVIASINDIIQHNKKIYFVTNAPHSTKYLWSMIQSWGIKATEQMVISSGELAINMLLNNEYKLSIKNPVIYHLGLENNDLLDHPQISITTNIDKADLLFVTLSWKEGEINLDAFDDLLHTVVKRKMLTICASPDRGIMQQGVYRYCAGYFVEKIKQLGGSVTYIGKPYPEMYQKILDRLCNVSKKRILMIGDTLYTDILGANTVGIHSALVLTGNAVHFHNIYTTLEEKLFHIKLAAIEHNVILNFIIELRTKNDFYYGLMTKT